MSGETPGKAPNSTPPGEQSPLVGSPELMVPHRTTPALMLSLMFHVVLLTAIGIIWSQVPKGTGAEFDRPIGIALVHRMQDREKYIDATELAKPEPQTQATETQLSADAAAAAAAPPAAMTPPIDLNGILKAMEATPSQVSGTGLAGETNLSGDAFGSARGKNSPSTGDEATTMVFGVSGSGSRFVYVFDRSDSMNGYGGRPLRSAKSELIRSIRSLTERQRFQIVFYNDKPTPFKVSGAPLQLISGGSSSVARAENYVKSVRAFGGTEHNTALKLALRMSPDVIFFLTDARIPRLSYSQLAEIKRRAEGSGTTIHAIEFGSEPIAPRDSFLRELASQNGGQYQYVDVRGLAFGADASAEKTQ